MDTSAPGRLQESMSDAAVLLLLSPDDDTILWSKLAEDFTRQLFDTIDVVYWERGERFPEDVAQWHGDWILSFRSDLIIPPEIYESATVGAINWHPSPPHFRGLGGQYYAIFEGHDTYGSTCHHMAPSVDSGEIIDARLFPIAPGETTTQLRQHVGAESLAQYMSILSRYIARGLELPASRYRWGDHLYTTKELATWLEETKRSDPDHACFQ